MSDETPDAPDSPEDAAAAAVESAQKGGIGRLILVVILLVLAGGGGALYMYRDRLLHGLVVHGGRTSFQSTVTLDLLQSTVGGSALDLDLRDFQVPDRNDLATNLFQFERFRLDATPSQLLAGKVHVAEASATGLEFFKKREKPAQPLPGAPPPEQQAEEDPTEGMGDAWQKLLDALGGEEGSTPEDVLERANLETVKYAKGLPARMNERAERLNARATEVRGKLTTFVDRAQEAATTAKRLKEEVPTRWRTAVAEKRQTFQTLEQQLKEDPKACGPDPKVDIPKRVNAELSDLVKLRNELKGQVSTLDEQVGPLESSFGELGPLVDTLQADVQTARKEGKEEVAMARKAGEADLKRLEELIDPIARNRELIERAIAAALAEDPVVALTEWARKAGAVAPAGPGGAEPRFRVDTVAVDGTIHLEKGAIAFSGSIKNLSDLPKVTGPTTFELSCTPPGAQPVAVKGEIDQPNETVKLEVTWTGLPLANRYLIAGDPEAGDPLPRRFTAGEADLTATLVSSPGELEIVLDGALRDLAWSKTPAGGPPLVGAVRAAVASLKTAHLKVTLTRHRDGSGTALTVEDLSEPSLGEALLASAGAEATAEADAAVKPYRDALDQRLATLSKEAAAAQATAMKPVEVELTACVDLRGKAEAHVRAAAPGNLTEAMAKDEEDLKASATKRLVAAAASATVGDEVEEGLENLKDKLPFGGFGD